MMGRTTDEDIEMMVQEIFFDSEISFGLCTLPTAKRTIARMNKYLEKESCEWRVVLTTDRQSRFPYGAKVESEVTECR